MYRKILLVCLVAALVTVAMPAAAQTSQTGSITGRVTYNGEGMPGVTVQISSESVQGDKVVVITREPELVDRVMSLVK